MLRKLIAMVALVVAAVSQAAVFAETENNNSKAAANAFVMSAGDSITGTSTGTSLTTNGIGSADYFKVTTSTDTAAIYRYRMSLSPGWVGTLRGLNQTAGVIGTTDTAVQTSSTLSALGLINVNQWYGFGKGESTYYRVTGTAATTGTYTASLTRSVVTPTMGGTYQAGNITFTTQNFAVNGTTFNDTEMYLYDANFNTQNTWNADDITSSSASHGWASTLSVNLNPGKYYLAVSNFNLATNLPVNPTDPSPSDSVMDFGDIIVNSNSAYLVSGANLNLTTQVTDSFGNIQTITLAKAGPYDIQWVEINVVPEPGTMTALGLGVVAMLRKRKSKSKK